MTYCVGTFSGGCDFINNRELGGAVKITEVEISHKPKLTHFSLL